MQAVRLVEEISCSGWLPALLTNVTAGSVTCHLPLVLRCEGEGGGGHHDAGVLRHAGHAAAGAHLAVPGLLLDQLVPVRPPAPGAQSEPGDPGLVGLLRGLLAALPAGHHVPRLPPAGVARPQSAAAAGVTRRHAPGLEVVSEVVH